MSTAHAPGPWTDDGPGIIHDRDARIIACLSNDAGDERPAWTDDEVEANGRLIAAAPELLEALKRLVQRAKLTKPSSTMVPLIEDAEDAIAKAEG